MTGEAAGMTGEAAGMTGFHFLDCGLRRNDGRGEGEAEVIVHVR